MTAALPPTRAVETARGVYLVQGLDRFAIGGDLDGEVDAAVEAHFARFGAPPAAVVWDDAVYRFRRPSLFFGLMRVFVPVGDALLARAFDSAARGAVRVDRISAGELQTSDVLGGLRWPDEVAWAAPLVRLIGWPDAAPLRDTPPPQPSRRAASISIVINYRDKAETTAACLRHIRAQEVTGRLQLLLVDNQSRAEEREAVRAAAEALFDADPRVAIEHIAFDEPFNHSRQCNVAAARATGEALVMLSNDCNLLDAGTLQAMADWALEPGVGVVGPRLIDGEGEVSCAGVAIGPRGGDADGLTIHEAEVPYLSTLVRGADGASFACAAIARATWERLGGADAARFPIDYNDADFCLRASEAGLLHLFLGPLRARHDPGLADLRTRDATTALHAELAALHPLERLARRNPSALPIRAYPPFANREAMARSDFPRIYRKALDAHAAGAGDPALDAAFAALAATAGADDATIDAALRAVCAAFLADHDVSERYRKSFSMLDAATAAAERAASPTVPIPLPAADHAATLLAQQAKRPPPPLMPPAGLDPDPDRSYTSFADRGAEGARHRLLIFADTLGPTQQILFVEALREARAAGEVAVRIMTEDDLLRLRSRYGEGAVTAWIEAAIAHLHPTAIVFSRFAEQACHALVARAIASLPDVPVLCQIDDDFFSLPAVIGVDRYREARHPRRIHCLTRIAAEADLILASTPLLGARLGQQFGTARIGLCPMSEGGFVHEPAPAAGPPVIGYFGSATHNRDLAMIAPALRRIKAARPEVRIEIVGSVARRSAAAALGDLVVRRPDLEHDYARFREAIRGWGWRIGLAPLMAHPFNAAKTPIKWTEYAQAGIPVIASRTEPYLELGREGAARLAAPDEWAAAITELLERPARREALRHAADRLLGRYDGWRRMEKRLLGLLDRAAGRRMLAAAA